MQLNALILNHKLFHLTVCLGSQFTDHFWELEANDGSAHTFGSGH